MDFHQEELKQLERHYQNTRNEIVLLYGDKQSGLSDILRLFLHHKTYYYYRARNCSPDLQLKLFYNEIREELPKGTGFNARYPDILSAMLSVTCQKRVIVIDDFQYLLKSDPSFMEDVLRTIHNKWNNQNVLFLLCTTAKTFVERDMVKSMSDQAYEFSSIIRLSELTFAEVWKAFPDYDQINAIELYSIFGAKAGDLAKLDPDLSLHDNVCRSVLTKGSPFYERGQSILPDELREPAVYHTILEALANGPRKLNELHKLTGFERAKISVYMKNLIEYGIVSKLESVPTKGLDHTLKGIYQIKDPFVRFWFYFIFPHYSALALMESEKFYRKYIDPLLRTYAGYAYSAICADHLMDKLKAENPKEKYDVTGAWYGKVGTIDLVACSERGHAVAAFCNFEKAKMPYADLEWDKYCVSQAGIKCDEIYLFSQQSFDEKIKKEAISDPSLHLIDGAFL
ncbi:MAG: ATP-binding protein [Lachnospiraceae bacterium]|nr:ATP-binding protein [Lachnospiraceae bacterium]